MSVENIDSLHSNKFISEEDYYKDFKIFPEKGDILMTRIGDVGTPKVIETEQKLAYYVSLALLKIKTSDSYFICYSIMSPFVQKEILSKTLVTATPKKINKSDINKVKIYISKISKEQRKISKFMNKLDSIITLEQQKIDNLELLKDYLLQNMFVNEDESPNLRFSNFKEEWIQYELSELVVQKKSYSLSRSVETNDETGYKYIHYGDIHTNKVNLVSDDRLLPNIVPGDYELLEKDDLILADASEDYDGIAWPSVIICNPINKIVAGLHTIVLRPHRISSIFLYYHIHTLTFRKFGSKVGTGMKVFGITAKNLLKYKLYIPTFDEQIKIQKILLLLDKTITLEQTKLEKLDRLKQKLLSSLFI
ncbi:hypothetical protein A1D21_02820 [Aerococcus loyolae]|nr:hypothetical protein A1D21_02820 [Aerococcus loyolae]